jgi:hypothetical protein
MIEPPIDAQALFNALVVGIPPALAEMPYHGEKNGEWTIAVKKVLCQLAADRGYDPYCEGSGWEYLLDVVWRQGSTGAILLAAECQWQYKGRSGAVDELLEDFEKLPHFKAPVKLFIYETKNHGEPSDRYRKCLQEYPE